MTKQKISARVILLAVLLAPCTAYWSANQLLDTIFSLMVPPVAMTLALALINLVVRRFAPRFALSEGELLVFYAMHAVIGAVCAEWMGNISPAIHSYALFHASDTRYDRYINPYTHRWFFIQPQDAPKYEDFRTGGHSSFAYLLTRLPLWVPFIASWTVLVTLVCSAMLCINSLMRDEWTTREKLAFPIVQVPMEIVRIGAGKSAIFRSLIFLTTFGVMFAIDMMNGLHFLYPSIPSLNLRYLGDLHDYTPSAPLNAIGWTPIGIFPYIAVIGFFMPTDLLFSCIFFFFFRKGMQIFTYSIGYTDSAGAFGGGGLVPSAPYFSEQSWGAFLGLFVTAAWVARNYLREVWQKIVAGTSGEKDVPPRLALIGLIVSLIGLGVIGWIIGIPFWMMAFSVALFLMFSVALTRMRAQIGAPSHEMAFMGPNQMLVDFLGTRSLPEAGVSRLVTTLFIFNRIHRTHPMPHQLEAMKMGETAQVSQRALFVAILVATVVGSVLGHVMYIWHGYQFAAVNTGGDQTGVVAALVERHLSPNPVAMLFVVGGFLFVLLLDFLRVRFAGFPLHPVGYALAMNFGLDYFWFGLIIVWIIKVLVERYYGLSGHGKLRDAAIGIILAEFTAETIWAIYAMVNHQATFTISINGRLRWDQ